MKVIQIELHHPGDQSSRLVECPILKELAGLALIERPDGWLSITHMASGLMAHGSLRYQPGDKKQAIKDLRALAPIADWTLSQAELASQALEDEILAVTSD